MSGTLPGEFRKGPRGALSHATGINVLGLDVGRTAEGLESGLKIARPRECPLALSQYELDKAFAELKFRGTGTPGR